MVLLQESISCQCKCVSYFILSLFFEVYYRLSNVELGDRKRREKREEKREEDRSLERNIQEFREREREREIERVNNRYFINNA